MTYDEEQAVRDRLEQVARTTPPVGFGPADLIRHGRRQRRQRRGLAIGASAVALALVVAVPAVALRGSGTGGTGTPAADAPTRTPSPPSTGSTFRVPGPIPGLSAAEARTLARECGRSYGGDIGHVNPTPEPGRTQGPLVRDAVRVYNAVRDAVGLHVLLYGPGTQVSCDVAGSTYSAGGSSGDPATFPAWLPGAVSVDNFSGTEDTVVVEGRVSGAVSSVVVTVHGRTLRMTPVNGTYIARFLAPLPPPDRPEVTAYDRAGKVLGRTGADTGCYADGTGVVVIPGRGGGCEPATPWR
jgi:hypothetical protein